MRTAINSSKQELMTITKSEMVRHALFIFAVILAAAMVYPPLRDLFASRFKKDYHTLIPFIPVITAYLLYLKKNDVSGQIKYSPGAGTAIVTAGLLFYGAGHLLFNNLNPNDYATIAVSSALVMLWGAFVLAYGTDAFKAVLFPMMFLIFMIPVPAFIMERIITFLQIGSTEFANLLFWLSQAPYYRDGFVFQLPGMSVEVAPQCSGIRSGLALFITAWLAGYLFLDSGWRRIALVLFVFPVTMFKNGIRIASLTLLGTYVDPRVLQSSLHREGGIPFFILALLLMAPILYWLKKR
jgi:exosortase